MAPKSKRGIKPVRRVSFEPFSSESEGVGMSLTNIPKSNRWMAWQLKVHVSGAAESEPSKPTKPGSVGFEGAMSGEAEVIRGGAEPLKLAPCGSPHGGGCYEVRPGVRLHPPKVSPEWTA